MTANRRPPSVRRGRQPSKEPGNRVVLRCAIGMRAEATRGPFPEPKTVPNGGDIAPGMTEISGVPVEFRQDHDNEALHMLVAVLPDQKVAFVQDLARFLPLALLKGYRLWRITGQWKQQT